jgi:hypothetical protein
MIVKEDLIMATDGETFDQWLEQAGIPPRLRSPKHLAVLQAAFAFRQQAGCDYASQRILAHFLLNCRLGWKLAQIARLVGVTRSTASRQNQISSQQVVREIHHRLSGRPYGKLLPRYAGPIAQFLIKRPDARRDDLLDFIESTWQIRVSLTALHSFLKKYGLDRPTLAQNAPPPHVTENEASLLQFLEQPATSGLPVPRPPEIFFSDTRTMRAPSC